MLRTRRRDNNVKPNRRLDRKSSRGMLYENEELRLKTININAEIERGQSDIKKLKRENEMLKKEIWCLRDEYDKLDKLLKDKKMDFSSSSTTCSSSSETESCSSCTEESEEVETSQNLKNVQRTNLKTIQDQFDHLSIVTEETSCENSEQTSQRLSIPNDQNDNMLWNYKNVIKPDQSYPVYGNINFPNNRAQTLPNQHMPMNYFAPIQHSKSFDDNRFNQVHQVSLYPEDFYTSPPSCQNNGDSPPIAISPTPSPLYENEPPMIGGNDCDAENFLSKKVVHTKASNFYQNVVLAPKNVKPQPEVKSMEKKATDLIVKIDNQNFNNTLTYSNTTPSTTFSNGGNLEELLHDIESISQDILKLTNLQRGIPNIHQLPTIQEPSNDQYFGEMDDNYQQNSMMEHDMVSEKKSSSDEILHKSELSVVLMPKAMPLIGFDKYKSIQRSFESLNSKSLSASQQNLCSMGPIEQNVLTDSPLAFEATVTGGSKVEASNYTEKQDKQEHNPFFFGNLNDNYVHSDYFSRRYIPDNFLQKQEDTEQDCGNKKDSIAAKTEDTDSSTNQKLFDNEETNKMKTFKDKEKKVEITDKKDPIKSPKMSLTRKVSIHFKGKKEKERLKKLALGGSSPESKSTSSKTAQDGKRSSIFDFKINTDSSKENSDTKEGIISSKSKEKNIKHHVHQKTPSMESKKSTTETSNFEPKTPNSSESDKRTDKKEYKKEEKKGRKSMSVSPDRVKHVHLLHEGQATKRHKKHRRERSGASRLHRAIDPRLRERSFSICTDRSMVGPGMGLGMGYGSFMYEDYSDRERTNSGSSCDSHENHRKMSGISNVPLNGKVPWCGCWGNGCL